MQDKNALDIKLSLAPEVEVVMSEVQKDYLEEEMAETIPQMEKGQINISGVYAYKDGDKLEVKFYIVNGLNQEINLEKVPLKIITSTGEEVAYQVFDLKEMGNIPPCSARPGKVYFNKGNVFVDEIKHDDWKLVFDGNMQAVKYADIEFEKFPEDMTEKDKNAFNEFLKKIRKVEKGQFAANVFTMLQYKNGDILLTLVFRNGSDKEVALEKLPLTLEDENKDVIFSAIYTLEDFKISAQKARILSVVVKKDILLKDEVDLTKAKLAFNLYN